MIFDDDRRQDLRHESRREKDDFYKALLDDMVTFVAVLDPSGTVVFVNNTPLIMAGLKLEEVKGKKFYDAPWWTYSDITRDAIPYEDHYFNHVISCGVLHFVSDLTKLFSEVKRI